MIVFSLLQHIVQSSHMSREAVTITQHSPSALLVLGDDVLGLSCDTTIFQRSGSTVGTNLARAKLERVSILCMMMKMMASTYQVGILSSHTGRVVLHLRLDGSDSILEVLLLLVVRLSSRVGAASRTVPVGSGERVTALLVGSSDTLGVGGDAVRLRSVAKDLVFLALKLR